MPSYVCKLLLLSLCGLMVACVTTPTPNRPAAPIQNKTVISGQSNTPADTATTTPQQEQNTDISPAPDRKQAAGATPLPTHIPYRDSSAKFSRLAHWNSAQFLPAFQAFKKSCARIKLRPAAADLHAKYPQYGTYGDWQEICERTGIYSEVETHARHFFEQEFSPLSPNTPPKDGLLTGYYEPVIDVRLTADSTFTEPVLTRPKTAALQNRPRAEIDPNASDVIAYGRPIDIFFMQVQGSGRLQFPDGRQVRAAFDGHNSHKYSSIGAVLIRRGVLTRESASKGSIERWMNQAGPAQAKALMNENKRYIFFKSETIAAAEGPKGAAGLPLTAMGSIAIDPSFYTYGLPIWLDTALPQSSIDVTGKATGLLTIAQDTGSAIRGVHRADLYFGTGDAAGQAAGRIKHPLNLTVLVPNHVLRPPRS